MTRIVFMGTPEFAVPSLAALLDGGYEVAGVLTRADQPAGRGQRLEASPVKQVALARGLAIRQPRTLRDPAARDDLARLAPDIIVVAAYGLILPREVLALPARGCVNVHGSLLPRHRGAAPIPAAILAGDAEAGVCIMLMDAGVDTGPVLSRAAIPITAEDTTGSLTKKLAVLGAGLLVETLPRYLAGEVTPEPQAEDGASFAPRIAKADGEIHWDEPAELIARRVRAYQPWPSAFTWWNGQLLKVVRAQPDPAADAGGLAPGTVMAAGEQAAGVATGRGVLRLEEVQLAGKRSLPIQAFLQGARDFIGSRLGRSAP